MNEGERRERAVTSLKLGNRRNANVYCLERSNSILWLQ